MWCAVKNNFVFLDMEACGAGIPAVGHVQAGLVVRGAVGGVRATEGG